VYRTDFVASTARVTTASGQPLVQRVIRIDGAGQVPSVDGDVHDAVLEKIATTERTPWVVNDALHGTWGA
jgi:hypothetical protein